MATTSGTYKAGAIEALLASDPSGRLRALHEQLVALGLKTKISRNTDTLLFTAATPERETIGVAAMRGGNTEVLSFPRTYWIRRVVELDAALTRFANRHLVPTEGAVSSSQYSLRQVRVSPETLPGLQAIIDALIRAHIQAISRGDL